MEEPAECVSREPEIPPAPKLAAHTVARMSGFMSRWVVLQEHAVVPDDLDGDGFIHRSVVERWVAGATAAYLDRCGSTVEPTVAGLALRASRVNLPPTPRLRGSDGVAVSASATELRPTSFTVACRVRSPEAVVNATCAVSLEDPRTGEAQELGDRIRDELIRLEQGAQHFN
jgi:acyl-CoA thioesterase FadM